MIVAVTCTHLGAPIEFLAKSSSDAHGDAI